MIANACLSWKYGTASASKNTMSGARRYFERHPKHSRRQSTHGPRYDVRHARRSRRKRDSRPVSQLMQVRKFARDVRLPPLAAISLATLFKKGGLFLATHRTDVTPGSSFLFCEARRLSIQAETCISECSRILLLYPCLELRYMIVCILPVSGDHLRIVPSQYRERFYSRRPCGEKAE